MLLLDSNHFPFFGFVLFEQHGLINHRRSVFFFISRAETEIIDATFERTNGMALINKLRSLLSVLLMDKLRLFCSNARRRDLHKIKPKDDCGTDNIPKLRVSELIAGNTKLHKRFRAMRNKNP